MKMKLTMLALAGICLSCNKSADTPAQVAISQTKTINSVSSPIEEKFVINGYDTVVLKMVMEPVLSCGSYRQGETPKPCDIFINFNCTLSQPVDGYVAVDIIKKNTSGPTYPALEGGKVRPVLR
jgi:hypothetical protein